MCCVGERDAERREFVCAACDADIHECAGTASGSRIELQDTGARGRGGQRGRRMARRLEGQLAGGVCRYLCETQGLGRQLLVRLVAPLCGA